MNRCFLIRHADAGARGIHHDEQRTLSTRGRAQAAALAEQFSKDGIQVIRSSPFPRCTATVAPLAAVLHVTTVADERLAEGAGSRDALGLIESATVPTALCSHGDVIEAVMRTVARRGVPLASDKLAKASTWVLSVTDGVITDATYLSPPSGL